MSKSEVKTGDSPGGPVAPPMQETRVPSLGWEDPLEKGMATHFRFLAWRIPWTEEPCGYSAGGCTESGMTEQLTQRKTDVKCSSCRVRG